MGQRFIKLVRDNVSDDRDVVMYEKVPFGREQDFHWALKRKLIEESLEYIEYGWWEELVDVYEVLRALVELHNKRMDDLVIDADRKVSERGGFRKRIAMWIWRPNV